jgi:hypothetical protein
MAVEEMAEKFLELAATTGSSSGGRAEVRTSAARDRKGKGRA